MPVKIISDGVAILGICCIEGGLDLNHDLEPRLSLGYPALVFRPLTNHIHIKGPIVKILIEIKEPNDIERAACYHVSQSLLSALR